MKHFNQQQKGTPLSCRKGKVFKGKEGAEKRKLTAKKELPRGTLFYCLCCQAQPTTSRVTDASNSNGSPAWGLPRDLICFTSVLPSQRRLVAPIPSPTRALPLSGSIRDGGTVQGEEYKSSKPQILQTLVLPSHSQGLDRLAPHPSQLLGQCAPYPNKGLPKTLRQCLGLEFSVGSPPILSLTHVPAKSAECPEQRQVFLC